MASHPPRPLNWTDIRYTARDAWNNPGYLEVATSATVAAYNAIEDHKDAAAPLTEALRAADRAVNAHNDAVERSDRVGADRPPAEDLDLLQARQRKASAELRIHNGRLPGLQRDYLDSLTGSGSVVAENAAAKLDTLNQEVADLWTAFRAAFDQRDALAGFVAGGIEDPQIQANYLRSTWQHALPGFVSNGRYSTAVNELGKAAATAPNHRAYLAASEEAVKARVASFRAQHEAEQRRLAAEDDAVRAEVRRTQEANTPAPTTTRRTK